ncbi:secondary thiamine-phosphate synthase enzyme YjbQ [Varunaivibrio sulfuroxidans]|uniref:Secondary thiamine-phosphate synthase enzyme n=1 Tax=Varunaivibrio sulfuroxidans TaxID=1773489 RepID=A0A4R3JG92_9PROT|nr:secondary thiamine-phosphate synthase enzyme YjbQ [Varunaivibrio sulfuroxidans]TCS65168.1 secondary thiamine-phosphate synthase enzyme [Varunaivibrio sulfuroxidans]WES29550.1 secondary thiamine-phosphate synthase enzyme YjbQ [Varunaivibrio sulfuroxidans]
MHQAQTSIGVKTSAQGLYEITEPVARWTREQALTTGLLTVFCRHTSASLVIQENADPHVATDLQEFFRRIAPENEAWYRHTNEGPDDMPAHIKSALTATSLCIPVADGRLVLGTWQGIYLFEHRAHGHTRTLVMHVLGA